MTAELYWIDDAPGPGRLGIMPRPRGGDELADDMQSLRGQGVEVLVSLLTDDDQRRLNLAGEAEAAESAGLAFRRFPIRDMGVPDDPAEGRELVEDIAARVRSGQAVAVHCQGGIGRSGLVLGGVLVRLGMTADAALAAVARARGFIVPQTDEQLEWVHRYEREMGG